MWQYGRTLWQLARPKTLILIWLQFALLLLFLGGGSLLSAGLGLLCIAAWYIHAVAINDLSDQEVDAINLPALGEDKDRPLVNATATPAQLQRLSVSVFCVVVGASAAIHWLLVPVALVMLVLNYAYSLPPPSISKRGGWAQTLLPVGYVLFPVGLALAIHGFVGSLPFALLVAGLYVLFAGRLLLKDIRDERGDAQVGKRTFLVRHGSRPTLMLSGLLMTIGIAIIYGSLVIYDQAYITLSLLLPISAGAIWLALRACARAKRLEYKLLFVALVGRIASSWVFYGLLVAVFRLTGAPARELLLVFAAGLFGFGCLMLIEELHATKKRFNLPVAQ